MLLLVFHQIRSYLTKFVVSISFHYCYITLLFHLFPYILQKVLLSSVPPYSTLKRFHEQSVYIHFLHVFILSKSIPPLSILYFHNSHLKSTLPFPPSSTLHYYYTILPFFLYIRMAILRKVVSADKSPSPAAHISQTYVSISNKILSQIFP